MCPIADPLLLLMLDPPLLTIVNTHTDFKKCVCIVVCCCGSGPALKWISNKTRPLGYGEGPHGRSKNSLFRTTSICSIRPKAFQEKGLRMFLRVKRRCRFHTCQNVGMNHLLGIYFAVEREMLGLP